MRPKYIGRFIKIAIIWQRYGLDETLFVIPWLKPLRFVLWLNPLSWFARRNKSYPQRLCLALEALGPLAVKFGQLLSTRSDLFTPEIANALASLQDKVKPFESKIAQKLIEQSLEQPIDKVFAHFDLQPLASASIAQVHAGQLHTGEDVIIKVLRPNINKIIEQDIGLLYRIAKLLEKYLKRTRKMHLVGIVKELDRSLSNEIDLRHEAANASQLKRNAQSRYTCEVPQIYWAYCTRDVMVMERFHGIPAGDLNALKTSAVNLKLLAKRGIELFYQQVFEDCFFHADLHPGNIFINAKNPQDPTYMLMDFGIMGSLTEQDQYYLAANFLAFFKRDYRRVAKLHIDSGWAPKNTNLIALEGAVRAVCEPIFERPLKDISMGRTLLGLIEMAREFQIEIQPQLILMQKTLLNIEGLARVYDPDLDLWATAKPFLEKWMRDQFSVKTLFKKFKAHLPQLMQQLESFPEKLQQ